MSADLFGAPATHARAIGAHESHSGGTDEWLTPPSIIEALGAFDLDPCSPINRPWPTARHHFTIADDGLRQQWEGRVWLNPPYAHVGTWLHRLAEHGAGTALIFARTETAVWFDHVWPRATAVLFLRGRINFHYVTGRRAPANAGAPSALIAYGALDAKALRTASLVGQYIPLGATA